MSQEIHYQSRHEREQATSTDGLPFEPQMVMQEAIKLRFNPIKPTIGGLFMFEEFAQDALVSLVDHD